MGGARSGASAPAAPSAPPPPTARRPPLADLFLLQRIHCRRPSSAAKSLVSTSICRLVNQIFREEYGIRLRKKGIELRKKGMREKGERKLPAPRASDEVGRMGVNFLFKVTPLQGSVSLEIQESSRVRLHVFSFFGRNRITTGEALSSQIFWAAEWNFTVHLFNACIQTGFTS